MKKLLVVFAAAFVALSLAACGGSPDLPEDNPQDTTPALTKAYLLNNWFAFRRTLNTEELQTVRNFIDNEFPSVQPGNKMQSLELRYYYNFTESDTDNSLCGNVNISFYFVYSSDASPTDRTYLYAGIERFINFARYNFDWDVNNNKLIISNLTPNSSLSNDYPYFNYPANLELYGNLINSKLVITYPKASAASVYMGTGSIDITHNLAKCSTLWLEDGNQDIFIRNDISAEDVADYGEELVSGTDYTQNGLNIVLTDVGAAKYLYMMLQMEMGYSTDTLNPIYATEGTPGYFLVYNKKTKCIEILTKDFDLEEDIHYTKTHGSLVRVLNDAGLQAYKDYLTSSSS